jgi:hypothetical protein
MPTQELRDMDGRGPLAEKARLKLTERERRQVAVGVIRTVQI